MLIYLTGFMASGKTRMGKALAKKLQFNFVDLDAEISKDYNLSITDFFEKFGESHFRIEEQNQLHKTSKLTNTVVSVGGGTPCFFNNIDVMNHYGTTVYLKMPIAILYERLKKGKAKRPILQDKDDDEMLEFIESMIKERSEFYEASKIKFVGKGNSEKDAIELATVLKNYENE